MTPEIFENHQVFEKLEQINVRLLQEEVKEKIEIDKYAFFESTYKYIKDRLNLTIPILVQDAELNALSSELEGGLTQINAFLGNNNIGHLNNANNNFNSALNRIRNFPLPFAKSDFNFSKSISGFEKTVFNKYSILEKENKKINSDLSELNSQMQIKQSEIDKLSKLLIQKETEIQNLNSSFQTEFNNIKATANQNFEQDRKTYRTEIDSDRNILKKEIEIQKENIKTDTSKLMDELNNKLEESKRLVNIIGNVGVTGNYQLIANSHEKSANFWRGVAIIFMLVLSGILIYVIWDLSGKDYVWTKSLIRILAAAALSYPATYAARESSKHRKLETINRKLELELASINPFIEILKEDQKQEIKKILVERYFGNNTNVIDELDSKQDDEISIGGFEKIIKALLPFLKK